MVFVVFAIMVIGILGALVLLYTSYALRNAVGVTPASRAQATAEAGLDIAHAMLASEQVTDTTTSPITGTMYGGNGVYSVEVVKNPDMGDGDPYDWRIVSTGTYTSNVEGVNRDFYRTLEEVISFAGGRYYSALDYVLFSKEGDIDINLDGELDKRSVQGILIDGSIYAGEDIVLGNAARLMAGSRFMMYGDVVTERGDIIIREENKVFAASDMEIRGNFYSGIRSRTGDVGGGVYFENDLGVVGGGKIDLTGDINSHGRLRDYENGVRFFNEVTVLGSCNTHVSGSVRSARDVYGENYCRAFATSTVDIDGTVHCGEDVYLISNLNVGGAGLYHDINGSIYAAGNVELFADGNVAGMMRNRVGGDIQAGGNVDITQHFGVACLNTSGYSVGGSIYGQNVKLDSKVSAASTLANNVGENIYASGALDLDNIAGTFATSRVEIGGSLYTGGGADINTSTNPSGSAPVLIAGSVTGLDPPGLGIFAGTTMSLAATRGGIVDVSGDAKCSSGVPTITQSIGGVVNISGATSPAAGSFGITQATAPTPPTDYNEVLLPECDFDYYREMAKQQEALDGQQHYYDADVPDLDIPAGAYSSSLFVIFVEGDVGIGMVEIPVACKAVIVATGDVTLQEEMRQQGTGDVEFQIIAGGKVGYDVSFNMSFDVNDRFFIYAADKDYNPLVDPISVQFEMGWMRGLYGQITARGGIQINTTDAKFTWGVKEYSIHFKSPSVLGEAFRVPFAVKSWKEL